MPGYNGDKMAAALNADRRTAIAAELMRGNRVSVSNRSKVGGIGKSSSWLFPDQRSRDRWKRDIRPVLKKGANTLLESALALGAPGAFAKYKAGKVYAKGVPWLKNYVPESYLDDVDLTKLGAGLAVGAVTLGNFYGRNQLPGFVYDYVDPQRRRPRTAEERFVNNDPGPHGYR
jgi:hypothetical protein